MKSSYASKRMLAQLYSIIDREKHEKYLFLPLWKHGWFTRDSAYPNNWVTVNRWMGVITLRFQHFTERFKQKDSVINTSAITAVTKSSMKPWRGTTVINHHLHGSGERNWEQRRAKVSFGKTMTWAMELLWLAKRHISGRSDVEQWRNQTHSLSAVLEIRKKMVWHVSI